MFKVNTIKDYSKPKRGVKKLRNLKKKEEDIEDRIIRDIKTLF